MAKRDRVHKPFGVIQKKSINTRKERAAGGIPLLLKLTEVPLLL